MREGIIKHSHIYAEADYPQLAEYLLDLRPPLEAQLIDLTDEIAYNTADLDDGYEAHILALPEIRSQVSIFDRYYREAEKLYPAAQEKLKFNEALKRMLNRLVTDLIENTSAQLRKARVRTVDDVRQNPARLAGFSHPVDLERAQSKSFLYDRLYMSAALQPEKDAAERVITEMFEFWISHPEALPASYQEKAQKENLPRVVCDYIAGMTDTFILEQYQQHCGGGAAEAIRRSTAG